MYRMLHNTGMTYLKGLGGQENILQTLSGANLLDLLNRHQAAESEDVADNSSIVWWSLYILCL